MPSGSDEYAAEYPYISSKCRSWPVVCPARLLKLAKNFSYDPSYRSRNSRARTGNSGW